MQFQSHQKYPSCQPMPESRRVHQDEPNMLQNEVILELRNIFRFFWAGSLPKTMLFFGFYTKFGVWKKIFWPEMMKLGLLSQVELTPNTVGAKCGKTNPALCNADFSKIFWSKTLKHYCTSDFYQFLKLFEPKEYQFCKNAKKLKFHQFFTFFWKIAVNDQKLTL